MPTTGIVEGFEENFCKIEIDGKITDVPRHLVDPRTKSGDVVEWDGSCWISNHKATKQRSQYIKSLMDDVWAD